MLLEVGKGSLQARCNWVRILLANSARWDHNIRGEALKHLGSERAVSLGVGRALSHDCVLMLQVLAAHLHHLGDRLALAEHSCGRVIYRLIGDLASLVYETWTRETQAK